MEMEMHGLQGKVIDDVLLRDVGQALTLFADQRLRPLLEDSKASLHDKELASQILLLQRRSRDAFLDFGEFYCIRLLLDHQSALASYFIDLFSQLHWMLDLLWIGWYDSLACLVRRIAVTCRMLYAAYSMSQQDLGGCSEEFKRAGHTGRMFSNNKLHCRMRQLGFVNLDQPGGTLVTLKEELGTGAFATVYKGVFEVDRKAGKNQKMIIGDPVAVKMFTSNANNSSETGISFGSQLLHSMKEVTCLLSSDKMLPEWMDISEDVRLQTELGRLISVRHPNIVTPRGYIGRRPHGESGLVMEAMDESLHDYLQKVEGGSVAPLAELEMVDLMLEIAKGMRFLHECNLMHGDLKPKNVLLRYLLDQDLLHKRFEVKLADFGLTKLYSLAQDGVEDKCTHTAPVGTTCYMAPELRGNSQTKVAYEEKRDVFSYGTTCFNILIGNPDAMAFAQSREGFYDAVKTGQWKQWVQGLDRNLSYLVTLVARCWETDPNMRPTFATLCLLLQHSLRRLFTVRIRTYNLGPLEDLKLVQTLASEQYVQCCESILGSFLELDEVIGLEVIGRIWEENFRDLKQPLIFRKNNFRWDVCTYLEALEWPNPAFVGNDEGHIWARELLDIGLEASDPLIFIKGLACHAMWEKAWTMTYSPPSPKIHNYFDFKNDGAYSELRVDASLVPLLLGFWTLSHFDDRICVYRICAARGS